MKIISRSEWGARPPKSRRLIDTPTPELWLHHAAGSVLPGDNTVSSTDLRRIRAIQNYHMDVRGWADIAYSYILDPDGNVFEGRGAGVSGAHTRGHNTISHGICIMGNYNTQSVDSDLLGPLAEFVVYGYQQGWWPPYFSGGHRDAGTTSCPGNNLYAELNNIDELVKEVLMSVSSWAETAWDQALAAGIVTDKSRPQALITVEQLMVFLKRANALPASTGSGGLASATAAHKRLDKLHLV